MSVLTTPLILRARSDSLAGPATFGVSDNSLLQNPLRRAMLIDEIRWLVVDDTSTPSAAMIDTVGCSLSLGRLPLTNGFIPIRLFGVNESTDMIYDQAESTVSEYQAHSWRLPRPLYLAPTEYIHPRFQMLAALAGGDSLSVRIAYVGRMLPEGHVAPKVIDVPWVSAFVGASQATGTDYVETSVENDLSNPFDGPLFVKHFIGITNFAPGDTDMGNEGTDAAPDGAERVSVQVFDHNGNSVCRSATRFWSLFSPIGREWRAKCVLPSKGYFIFVFDERLSGATGSARRTVVSMIGHRKVQLNKVAYL